MFTLIFQNIIIFIVPWEARWDFSKLQKILLTPILNSSVFSISFVFLGWNVSWTYFCEIGQTIFFLYL